MNNCDPNCVGVKCGRLHMSDVEWGWLCSERSMGSNETQIAASRVRVENEHFVQMLQEKLAGDRELQQEVYALILAKNGA